MTKVITPLQPDVTVLAHTSCTSMEPPRDWHRQINKVPNDVIGTFRLPIVNLRHNKVETLKAD